MLHVVFDAVQGYETIHVYGLAGPLIKNSPSLRPTTGAQARTAHAVNEQRVVKWPETYCA